MRSLNVAIVTKSREVLGDTGARIVQDLRKLHYKLHSQVSLCGRPTVVLTDEYFQFRYKKNVESARELAATLCHLLRLKMKPPSIHLMDDPEARVLNEIRTYSISNNRPSSIARPGVTGATTILVTADLIADPKRLTGRLLNHIVPLALAREYGVRPGNPGRAGRIADLGTVYLGCGVLTANAAFEFRQWHDGFKFGWKSYHSGWISEMEHACALAVYASMKGERQPAWFKQVDANVREPLKRFRNAIMKSGLDEHFRVCH